MRRTDLIHACEMSTLSGFVVSFLHWETKIAKIKDDMKHGSAVMRSSKLRAMANFLPEEAVKKRKTAKIR